LLQSAGSLKNPQVLGHVKAPDGLDVVVGGGCHGAWVVVGGCHGDWVVVGDCHDEDSLPLTIFDTADINENLVPPQDPS
jgi:hypothetical protein